MIQIAQRAQRIKPSATLAVSDLAAQLRREGSDIISLSTGEPDFNTPMPICKAAEQAIRDGHTKYTAADGMIELKEAICTKFARENNQHYTPQQVLVSSGAKQSIFNALLAIINDGDEVIIPAPYWTSYPDMVTLVGGVPIIVATDVKSRYKMSASQLAAAITPKTRLCLLNSPSNPSGQLYTKTELQSLGAVLAEHPDIVILSDDIYEHIVWSAEGFCNIVDACPELAERVLVINGVSKAYAMTGWRIGYAAGNQELIKNMKKIQSQSTSNPSSISQCAAIAALQSGTEYVRPMVTAFFERHTIAYQQLNAISGVSCLASEGTFYAFADVSLAMRNIGVATDADFAAHLLSEAQVAVVPGSAFGIANHIRLSFATANRLLEQALDRLRSCLT